MAAKKGTKTATKGTKKAKKTGEKKVKKSKVQVEEKVEKETPVVVEDKVEKEPSVVEEVKDQVELRQEDALKVQLDTLLSNLGGIITTVKSLQAEVKTIQKAYTKVVKDNDKFFNDPIGKENFVWGSPKSKNVDYKIEHPIFSTDDHGKPIISYIDQFPEPQSLQQGLYLNSLSESLEGSSKHIAFKLPPGYAIFSNNYFMLHGRKAFKPHPKLYRELLRQRGTFYK